MDNETSKEIREISFDLQMILDSLATIEECKAAIPMLERAQNILQFQLSTNQKQEE